MTNEQVKQGFNEVYNQFWNRHKDHVPEKGAEKEWDRILAWSSDLQRRYPFLKETILKLTEELDQRMRRGETR